MNTMHTVTILSAVLILMTAPMNVAVAERPGVCTWTALEDQLLVDMEGRDLDHQTFMGSPVFNALLERRDRHFYLEMAAQQKHPFLVLAAFFCLQKHFPELASRTAVEIVLAADPPGFLDAPVRRHLGEKAVSEGFREVLNSTFSRPPIRLANCILLAGSLSYDVLFDWFHHPTRPLAYPTCEAIVLDRLYEAADQREGTVSSMITETLNSYAAIPGYPRSIFVFHAAEDHERFAESLMCVLKDPGLEDHLVFIVVQKRRSYIAQLALDKLGLSEERQAWIDRALRREP